MQYLNPGELKTLGLGAALLGSGGGGDPAILYGHLHYLLEKNGPVKIIDPADLAPASLVVPLALIGAPLISFERIPNSSMFLALLREIKKHYPKRDLVLMPAEIGGCNAFTPFMLAAQTALPVLDGDLIGRAFPKLQMCKPAIKGKAKQRSYLSSPFGDSLSLETDSIESLEEQARAAALRFGCSAAIATFLFNAKEQENYLIPGSLSRALSLGRLLECHAQDLSRFAAATQAKKLGAGVMTEVRHALEGGFLTGYAEIKTAAQKLRVFYQNEYLLVQAQKFSTDAVINLAESPELIVILEARSGLPLTSEALRYGLKVEIFSLPAPAFWRETDARSQVDLKAFDFINERVDRYV